MTVRTMVEAIHQALGQEMERDERVIICGRRLHSRISVAA